MAKKISGDYANHEKADLQAEADSRKLNVTGTGASGAVIKEDLVKALEASDSAAPGAPGAPVKTFAETAPPNIPKVKEAISLAGAEPTPPAEDFTQGEFIRKSDGEKYALAVVKLTTLSDRTHRLMNTLHYWEGTEQQFIESFTKDGGKPIRLGDYPPKDAPKDYLSDEQKEDSKREADKATGKA